MNNIKVKSSIRFSEIQNRETLQDYLFNNTIMNVRSLVTYTKIKNLIKIIRDKKWYLGNPLGMNDQKEILDFQNTDWNRIFYSCFMADQKESIAMWAMYGRPWADGVSISIDRKSFYKWVKDKPSCYYKTGEKLHKLEDVHLRLVRVAYTNELTKGVSERTVVTCGKQENVWIDNIFKDDEKYDHNIFAGTIKDNAWAYENEIRIRADYTGKDIPNAVYIDVPDYIIENMIITRGPLFYGNLEYRLKEAGLQNLQLAQSQFTSMLVGMPCSTIVNNECKEQMALVEAKKKTPQASQLHLKSMEGKGVYILGNSGTIYLGEGEYEFPITWSVKKNRISLEGTIGRFEYATVLPTAENLIRYDFFHKPADVNNQVVLLVNEHGRVVSTKWGNIEESKSQKIVEVEYRIYPDIEIRIEELEGKQYYLNNSVQFNFSEKSDELCGTWWDVRSQRCVMQIYKNNNEYIVSIEWSSSAREITRWTMSGEWDDEKKELQYINEKCIYLKGYDGKNKLEVLTEYQNGKGRLYSDDKYLYWEDAQKAVGGRCKFEKGPFID